MVKTEYELIKQLREVWTPYEMHLDYLSLMLLSEVILIDSVNKEETYELIKQIQQRYSNDTKEILNQLRALDEILLKEE